MMSLSSMRFVILLAIASCETIMATTDLAAEFNRTEIVPDVLSQPPNELLKVVFKPCGTEKELKFGEEWTPTQVKDAPSVTWTPEPNAFYTLAMVDPDAPSRKNPELGQVMHWMVTNIPGNDVASGNVIAEHVGSGPPEGTGLHRYIFLLFKQPAGKIDFEEKHITNRSREGRLKFKIADFAKKYDLGVPIAGNMYEAQYDDYVPILRQQLSGN